MLGQLENPSKKKKNYPRPLVFKDELLLVVVYASKIVSYVHLHIYVKIYK